MADSTKDMMTGQRDVDAKDIQNNGRQVSSPSPLGVRPKRRRTIENIITKRSISGSSRALYHCNYCNKDISSTVRIKCAVCPDFDLCVECFSVGVEVTPHKNFHAYKVVENLSFPLFVKSWGADEELLLLEAVEMYGLGNWKEVSEHVATKSHSECKNHYFRVYFGSKHKPLPDTANIMGPDAAGTDNNEKNIDQKNESTYHSSDTINDESCKANEVEYKEKSITTNTRREQISTKNKKLIVREERNILDDNRQRHTKSEENVDKSVLLSINESGEERTPPSSGATDANQESDRKHSAQQNQQGNTFDVTGYNLKRSEFDTERDHDPDAEMPLADMEITGMEKPSELALKEKQLLLYYQRQLERYRRRAFVVERGLLNIKKLQTNEKRHTHDELELMSRYRVFSRYLTMEDQEQLAKGLCQEQYLRKKIDELKEWRRNGIKTLLEAEVYEAEKLRRESGMEKIKAIEAGIASGIGSKSSAMRVSRYLARDDHPSAAVATGALPRELQKLRTGSASTSQLLAASLNNRSSNRKPLGNAIQLEGHLGCDSLTREEMEVCKSCKLLPLFYLAIKDTFIRENEIRGALSRSDARGLIPADNSKLLRVYDFMLQHGLIKAPSVS